MPIVRHGYSTTPNRDSAARAKNRRLIRQHATHCGICGQPFTADDQIEVDHIIPVSAGGTHHILNLRATHRSCNRRRGQG